MYKVFIFMFVVIIIASVIWANAIENTKNDKDDTPWP